MKKLLLSLVLTMGVVMTFGTVVNAATESKRPVMPKRGERIAQGLDEAIKNVELPEDIKAKIEEAKAITEENRKLHETIKSYHEDKKGKFMEGMKGNKEKFAGDKAQFKADKEAHQAIREQVNKLRESIKSRDEQRKETREAIGVAIQSQDWDNASLLLDELIQIKQLNNQDLLKILELISSNASEKPAI